MALIKTVDGGSTVGPGYYFSTSDLSFEVVNEPSRTLPGPVSNKFLNIPFPLLFVVIPVVGFAFLIFLPAIGFLLVAYAAFLKLTGQAPKAVKAAKHDKAA